MFIGMILNIMKLYHYKCQYGVLLAISLNIISEIGVPNTINNQKCFSFHFQFIHFLGGPPSSTEAAAALASPLASEAPSLAFSAVASALSAFSVAPLAAASVAFPEASAVSATLSPAALASAATFSPLALDVAASSFDLSAPFSIFSVALSVASVTAFSWEALSDASVIFSISFLASFEALSMALSCSFLA